MLAYPKLPCPLFKLLRHPITNLGTPTQNFCASSKWNLAPEFKVRAPKFRIEAYKFEIGASKFLNSAKFLSNSETSTTTRTTFLIKKGNLYLYSIFFIFITACY